MNGYEIVLEHLIAKARYEELIKFGYPRDDTNFVVDLISLRNNGMQDINVKLFEELDVHVEDKGEHKNSGVPFGFKTNTQSMKLLKKVLATMMLIVAFTFASTTTVEAQTGFSTSSYYSKSWGSHDQFLNSYYNAHMRYCENRRKMIWTKHYGAHQVRMWNYNTRRWYYQWKESYYYTYHWYNYWICS